MNADKKSGSVSIRSLRGYAALFAEKLCFSVICPRARRGYAADHPADTRTGGVAAEYIGALDGKA
jgi:hypothetical protein